MNDLRAEDSLYHIRCNSYFWTGKSNPMSQENSSERKRGRPADGEKDVFLEIANYLVKYDDHQFTLSEVAEMMKQKLKETETSYSSKWLKKSLQKHFGEKITFSSTSGRSEVITFADTISEILSEFKRESNKNEQDELLQQQQILIAAAKIVKRDIQLLKFTRESYPSSNDMEPNAKNLDLLPLSLQLLLKNIFLKN